MNKYASKNGNVACLNLLKISCKIFTKMHKAEEKTVLSSKFTKGPKGLGDPDDKSLRKVETEILIPERMRHLAKTEKCVPEVAEFSRCCKDSSFGMVFKCRKETALMKDCFVRWYNDPEFKQRCTEEYLHERSEYRRTGVGKPTKKWNSVVHQ